MSMQRKTASLIETRGAIVATLEGKRRKKSYLGSEGQYYDLRPYQTAATLLQNISEGEFQDIIARNPSARPFNEHISLTGEQMRALNDLKSALDRCEALGIAGYSKKQ